MIFSMDYENLKFPGIIRKHTMKYPGINMKIAMIYPGIIMKIVMKYPGDKYENHIDVS